MCIQNKNGTVHILNILLDSPSDTTLDNKNNNYNVDFQLFLKSVWSVY